MARIKQKYNAYKNAERLFNRRMVALRDAFTSEMHLAAKQGKLERFKALSEDLVSTLGEEYSFTVTQIKYLYGLG